MASRKLLTRRVAPSVEVVPASVQVIQPTLTERNPALVYLYSLDSQHSRRSMAVALRRFLKILRTGLTIEDFPWARLRYAEVVAARAALATAYGPACVNASLAAVRGVVREAFRLGQVPAEEYARVKEVKGVRAVRLPAGRDVPEDELAALFAACDRSDPVGIRDAALLAVLRVTGMRRAEACKVQVADLDLTAGTARVVGKRNKERLCPLGDAQIDVEAWLEVRGREPGPLFRSWSTKAGKFLASGLTESGVYLVLKKLAKAAGVELSPHDLRRTFVGDLLDEGVDLATVQKLAGHEDPATTSRYDRRGEEAKKEAASKLKIPR